VIARKELHSDKSISLYAMKTSTHAKVAFIATLVFLAGCETRSISNSGFDHRYASGRPDGNAGELSELDVLGVAADATISEADIQAALQTPAEARLARTSKVLLIQSGADFPDEPMIEAMHQRFSVAPFSGKPQAKPENGLAYAKALRLAAARGGFDKIVCYWGVLESERKNKITSSVSWVPIVGYLIPDERENMRIRLRAAIVDVASGRWTLVTPSPVASTSLSSILSRRETDQELVSELKDAGYRDLAQSLAEHATG
jgi:hypothetical protein